MDKVTYNVLIWAEDIGKFAKDVLEKKMPANIENVIVLGNEIKVTDLKALQQIEGLLPEIDNEYTGNKRDTELVMLGRCIEQGKNTKNIVGLMSFTSLDKEVQEVAKKMGIPIVGWRALKDKTPAAKKVTTRKRKESPKEEKIKEPKTPKEKKANTLKEDSSPKHENKETKIISTLINKSNMNQEDKDFFSKPENIALIKEAVDKASDVKIGFPFQLQMRFGTDKAQKLNIISEKMYASLRKEE